MKIMKKSTQIFISRFYGEPTDRRFFAVLPCIYTDNLDRTFEIAWFKFSLKFFYGKIKQ
jgi:hypothetical protein